MVHAGSRVRRIGADERPTLVDVFVAAFEADPWFRWRYAGQDYAALAREWFDVVVRLLGPRADAWVTAGGEAGAIWLRPGQPLGDADDLVEVGRLIERQHGDRTPEIAAAFGATADMEPDGPHWLCVYVGVRPEAQNRGLGRQVMAPALERCDHEGLPAFLTSTNPRNLPFYERLGFRSIGRREIAPGISFEAMLREPGA